MQSALSIFALDSIARLTAENDVDIEELGYGKRPVAIFIGLPSEDRSNHFLVTTFIAQVYQRLFQLTKSKAGKKQGELDRQVKFILDEFGNFPEIENFAGFVTVCLGLGISFDIYLQAMNQLASKYKVDEKTIKENFANQIYIKSVGEDTAKEFSEKLGNTTVIEVQRSGSRLGLNKNFTETATERPLMYHDELARLQEGECVIYRGIKRTDRLGPAVKSYPIINEYADTIGIYRTLKELLQLVKERIIGKQKYRHPVDDRDCTLKEEWKVRKNRILQKKGTALLYRYQYLTDKFPNPNEIHIEDINPESREHVNYTKMVVEPMDVLQKAMQREDGKKSYQKLKELSNCSTICGLLSHYYDSMWRRTLEITEEDTLSRVTSVICSADMKPEIKSELIRELGGDGF